MSDFMHYMEVSALSMIFGIKFFKNGTSRTRGHHFKLTITNRFAFIESNKLTARKVDQNDKNGEEFYLQHFATP